LFLCAGVVEQATHNKDITKMGGLIHTMPITAYSFLICSFSIMGVPPLGGFFSKYMVFMGSVQKGDLLITLLFLAGAIMTIVYLFRVFRLVFLGEAKSPAREGSFSMVASVAALSLLSLAGGFFVQYPNRVVQAIVQQTGFM